MTKSSCSPESNKAQKYKMLLNSVKFMLSKDLAQQKSLRVDLLQHFLLRLKTLSLEERGIDHLFQSFSTWR